MTNANTNNNGNWYNTPANYWTNMNWSNTPLNFTNGLTTNPFNTNPLTSGLTNLVNNTPYTPNVNAYENSDNYVLEFAAPGYNKESFEVSYNNNTLTVRANVERNNEVTNYSYREFNYNSFTREFQLPTNANSTETRAKYENGILTIMLPKNDNTSNTRTVKVS